MKQLLAILMIPIVAGFLFAQSTVLIGTTALTRTTKLGAAVVTGSWQFKTDGNYDALGSAPTADCGSTTSLTCTFSIPPTTANSAFSIYGFTINNVSLSSAAWNGASCGGTWSYPASGQLTDSTNAIYGFTAVNQGNTGGCTSVILTFSADHGNAYPLEIEGIPPAGTTAIYDTAANVTNASCDIACNGPSFTLTGNDFVSYYPLTDFTLSGTGLVTGQGSFNGCSLPYYEDYAAACFALNQTGTSTSTFIQCKVGTLTCNTLGFADAVGTAWKASAIVTTSPAQIWSLVSNAFGTEVSGGSLSALSLTANTASTAITTSSTQGGGAGFLWVAITTLGAGDYLTACTVGGTSGAVVSGFSATLASTGSISACFVPSEPASATSGTVTVNTTGSYFVGGYEIAKTNGAAALDCSNSTTIGTAANSLAGPTCPMTGLDDLVVSAIVITGTAGNVNECVQTSTFYPIPYDAASNCTGEVYSAGTYIGAVGLALNQTSTPVATYTLYDATTSKAALGVAAFK
jgi:hypothetical protein